ncbi:MAG: hypothetical protein KUG78_06630 [Kangiellaceae bacterium]|nr:hypothetical protein [Kangiellaceae bacterium]
MGNEVLNVTHEIMSLVKDFSKDKKSDGICNEYNNGRVIARYRGCKQHTNCMAISPINESDDVCKRVLYLGSQSHTISLENDERTRKRGQLTVIDISSPTSSKKIVSYEMEIKDMLIWANWLITVSIEGLFTVFDITNASKPIKVLKYQHLERVNRLMLESISGDEMVPTVFAQTVARGYTQVDLFALPNNLRVGDMLKISNKASAMESIVTKPVISGTPKRFFYYSDSQIIRTAIVNEANQQFQIQHNCEIDIKSQISALSANRRLMLVGTESGLVYVLPYCRKRGIGYIEFSGRLPTPLILDSSVIDIQISNNLAYISTANKLSIIDISNAKCLAELSEIKVNHPLIGVRIQDEFVLLQDTDGLSFYLQQFS